MSGRRRQRRTAGQACACAAVVLSSVVVAANGPARATPASKEVGELRVIMDSTGWLLEIPFGGRWSHWSMNTPPRIVVDLIDGSSRLPNAPALYSLDLPGGPVERLRTSQYSSEPGQRRVRVTLVLLEPARYEVREGGPGAALRIPRPEGVDWGELYRLTLDARGVRTEAFKPLPAKEPVPIAEPEPPATEPPLGPAWLDSTGEATLEELLRDTTFFKVETQPRHLAWSTAAARLLEDAQDYFLAGDSAACSEKLEICDRFYAATDPGRQSAVLRRLLFRAWGRVVEADLGSPPAGGGPWPLLADEVFQVLFNDAVTALDLNFADQILTQWGKANPDHFAWARSCMQLAELHLDRGAGSQAAVWVARALGADPQLQASPRALLLHAAARMDMEEWDVAEALLKRAEETASDGLQYRARAVRGDLRYRRRMYTQAVQMYTALLDKVVPHVEREWALYQLGNCWAELGDKIKARAHLQQVIEQSPESFWAPFARTRLMELGGGRVAARR